MLSKEHKRKLFLKKAYYREHPEEAIRMGENSRRFAEERFDQRVINRRIREIMEECLLK